VPQPGHGLSRLLAIEDDEVVFSYKDYRDQGRRKVARVDALEFIDRFLLHVPPRHVRRIRTYGFLSQNQRGVKLPLIRRLLGVPEPGRASEGDEPLWEEEEDAAGTEVRRPCPACKTGVLIEVTWPRPTIARIMRMTMEELRQSRLPFQ
jgi:hypothetical protein